MPNETTAQLYGAPAVKTFIQTTESLFEMMASKLAVIQPRKIILLSTSYIILCSKCKNFPLSINDISSRNCSFETLDVLLAEILPQIEGIVS